MLIVCTDLSFFGFYFKIRCDDLMQVPILNQFFRNAVCNGTDSEGKTDCEDGSDESPEVCQGSWSVKFTLIATLASLLMFGMVSYLVGKIYVKSFYSNWILPIKLVMASFDTFMTQFI